MTIHIEVGWWLVPALFTLGAFLFSRKVLKQHWAMHPWEVLAGGNWGFVMLAYLTYFIVPSALAWAIYWWRS